jgi:uracil-DNA glycosylase
VATAQAKTAAEYLPARRTLPALTAAVQFCRGCDLYAHATQAVFGEGPASARVVMIGEVPGDREDLQGHPFVGPAGRILDRALAEAGIRMPRRSALAGHGSKPSASPFTPRSSCAWALPPRNPSLGRSIA